MELRICIGFVLGMLVFHVPAFPQNQSGSYGDTYASGGANLTPLEQRGRETWYFWTGGGQNLWRQIAIVTKGATDLLLYVDSRRNGTRFRDLGVITQPGCRTATPFRGVGRDRGARFRKGRGAGRAGLGVRPGE